VEIEEHYALLLGIHSPWETSSVDLNMANSRVDIEIEYVDSTDACPECGTLCPKHDERKSRTWRHLDTMQFATYLHARLPRVKCKDHGVKTVSAPWTAKNSRFTLLLNPLLFELLKPPEV